MVESLTPTAGGGGGIDYTPRPVDFGEPDDDPRAHQKEAVRRAIISADYLRRYGGRKPQYTGSLPPELARIAERADTVPYAGEIAILGFNIFDSDPSKN